MRDDIGDDTGEATGSSERRAMVVRTSAERMTARLARRCSVAANTGDDPTRAVVVGTGRGAGAGTVPSDDERLTAESTGDDPTVTDPDERETVDRDVGDPCVDGPDVANEVGTPDDRTPGAELGDAPGPGRRSAIAA